MTTLYVIYDELGEFNLKESLRRMTAMFNAIVEFAKECCRRVAAALKQCIAAMKSAGIVDDECKPTRRKSTRPAWASPYGPAPKRTRR